MKRPRCFNGNARTTAQERAFPHPRTSGVEPKAGLTTGDAEEAAVKRALHERAAETIVLASAEKLMAASPFLVTPFQDITLLVIPQKTPDRIVRTLRAGGIKVERAQRYKRT
jgi:DeoR/GlpR family transcriptional regulator of sugar metabolism